MKTTFFISFFLILLFTSCALKAQEVLNSNPHWALTNCPQGSEALTVHGNYLFSGGVGGTYRSSDDGNTWQVVNKGLHSDSNPPEVRGLYSFGQYIFASVPELGGGLFRSIDDGNNWSTASSTSSVALTSHDKFLFSIPSAGLGILRSPDSGIRWESIDSSFSIAQHDYHKISFTKPAVSKDWIYAVNYYGEIYRSSNNGDSLTLIYSGMNGTNHHLYSINDTTLFAYASNAPSDTMYRSIDGGFNWQVIKTDFGQPEIVVSGNMIFGGSLGITFSTDNGNTWKSANEGLPNSLVIDALAIKDGFLFAGSYNGGLWKRSLSDFTNAVKNIDSPKQTPFVNVVGETIQFSNVDNNIDKIVFYNATGQIFKEIKNTGSTFSLPVKDFFSGFYGVIFSSKGIVTYTSKIIIQK